jgi:parallel beta-helix repeat protein
VKEGADPNVRRNRIHENKQSGIFANTNGRGTYEDNGIFDNGYSGFTTTAEADPIVRRNRIHENKQSGINARERVVVPLRIMNLSAMDVRASLQGQVGHR